MVQIDSEAVFNWGAGVLATVATLYFIFNVDLGLSPATTFAVVVAFLSGVFAITQRAEETQLTTVGYAVIVVSGVGVLFDLVSLLDVGNIAIVTGLLLLAGLLFGLRGRLDEYERFTSGRRATTAFGVVVAVAALVVVLDLTTGGIAYELQAQSEVTVPDREYDEVQVATVVASNPTPLPERVEAPRYQACAAGDWNEYQFTRSDEPDRPAEVNVHVDDGYDEHVLSFSDRTFPVVLRVAGQNVTGETFPIRVTDRCPDGESGPPSIALYEVPDPSTRATPV